MDVTQTEVSLEVKKKEVSWNNDEYLKKVQLQEMGTKSQACVMERESSIGPCFRAAAPFGRPSGLSICLAKKSISIVNEEYNPNQSVINITLSKKCLVNKTIPIVNEKANQRTASKKDPRYEIQDVPKVNIFGILRQKVVTMSDRIKKVFD